MDKRKPHYSLELVQELVQKSKWRVTVQARKNALNDFRIETPGIRNVVLNLKRKDFYKSMASHHNHTLWQDVYHPLVGNKTAYVKVQIISSSTVVIQFKEK